MKRTLFIFLFLPLTLWGQHFSVTGVIVDNHHQPLAFANILGISGLDSTLAVASQDGKFTLSLKAGHVTTIATYTGFYPLTTHFELQRDTSVMHVMTARIAELEEVVVSADRFSYEDHVASTRSGTNTLTGKDILAIPVLGGEADLIKTLQLLPGTVRGIEGSSDLFVRGGAADQNLVLLDDATIYNTSHLFGFLSVFNPDMLDRVEAINGGFPAEYGGRLSSILNVNTKPYHADRTRGSADVGLIASRLFVEQPIVRNKAGLWIGARRTYIDRVVRVVGEELPYFFYDLNGKLILTPSKNDRIEISHYGGQDILDLFRDANNDGRGFLTTYSSGNSSQSVRWQKHLRDHWRSTLSVMRTSFHYRISNAFEENAVSAFSDIEDYGARVAITNDSLRGGRSVKAGLDWTRHAISPNIINAVGTISQLLESSATSGRVANEFAAYAQQEWPVGRKWRVNAGLRASFATVRGKNYFTPEPRVSARYEVRSGEAIKLSYSRMAQYMHRISNSAISTPTDIWYPVTDSIQPQTGHQFSAAWQKFISQRKIYASGELYYKTMEDLVGYEEGTNLFFNTNFESRLIQGKGRAYGFEVLVRKDAGRLTGWVSYSLSWSWRQYDRINNGAWFPARYDRRHNGAIVAQYTLGKRWAVSAVWEFISGSKFTPIIGQYSVLAPTLTGIDLIPVFSGTNAVKLADAHRLDIGIKLLSKPERKFRWQWFMGVYNVYNRATPIGMVIEQNEIDGSLRYMQPGLFGTLPFISYGFRL